jgi:outer membrane protein assembly factor BamB
MRRSLILLACLVPISPFLLAPAASSPASWSASPPSLQPGGQDWPQWLGPRRDGSIDAAIPPWSGPLQAAWRRDVGEGHSSPIVADGKVFLHSKGDGNQEVVTAWDISGKELWRSSYSRPPYSNIFGNGPRATPAWADGKLYTLGVTGLLYCWDAGSGKELWHADLLAKFAAKNLFFGTSASPLVQGDLVYVMPGGKEGAMAALDAKTGEVRWKCGTEAASYASPMMTSIGGKDLVVFLTAEGVVGVDAAGGQEYWRVPLKDRLNESSTTPVRIGNLLFASSVTVGSIGIKLSAESGKPAAEQVWKNPELTCYFGTPVEFDGLLYVVTGQATLTNASASLHCVDPKTGKVLWTKGKVGQYHATLLRTRDKLLMLEEQGDLVMFRPSAEKYDEVCRSRLCGRTWAHPAWAGGVLYIRDAKELLAVKPGR